METTQVSLSITLIAVAVGILLIVLVGVTMKKKQISDYQGILWLIAAILIIVLGAFPGILGALADFFGIWWAPAILLFANAVLIGFISFNHSKEISVLKAQVVELSEQVSILKAEKHDKELQSEESSCEHSALREEHPVH